MGIGSGLFLGGMAEGMDQRRESDRKDALLSEQKRQALVSEKLQGMRIENERAAKVAAERKDEVERADKIVGDITKTITETALALKDAGRSESDIETAVAPLAMKAASLLSLTGRDPSIFGERLSLVIKTPAKPDTEAGKLQADFARGLIDEKMLQAQLEKLNAPASVGIVESVRRKIATGEALTEGERKVYEDAINADPFKVKLREAMRDAELGIPRATEPPPDVTAPAAAKPTVPTFASRDEAAAALKSGTIKSGDEIVIDGVRQKVK